MKGLTLFMRKALLISSFIAFLLVFSGIVIVNALNNQKINILIYGLDGREEDTNERSDALLLVNYNFDNSEMIVTSIPRDSYVKITCRNNQYDKINHAYAYGGEKCLKRTVSNLFGIKTMKNIVFDFKSVVEIVDYFGLIELKPTHSFCQIDEYGEINYCFEKNKKIQIDGRQALAYMRARKNLPNGDFDRIKHQREILKIIINEFMKLSVIEKFYFYNYAKNIIDTDLKIKDINVKKIIGAQQINLKEYTLKGEDYINTYYYYKLDLVYLEKIKKYYI